MLCCPARLPFRASSRFDGGIRKSSIRVAALNCFSRMAARFSASRGNRRARPVVKNRSVSASANDRIMQHACKQYVYDCQGTIISTVKTAGLSSTHPRLIPHHLIVTQQLLDRRAGRRLLQLRRRPREELPAARRDRRAASPVKTSRRASGEQARHDREDGETWHPVGHVAPRWFCACARRARRCGRLGAHRTERRR